jgi:membrane fusion protein, multidrug efflux system
MKLSNTTLSLLTLLVIFTVVGGMVTYRLKAEKPDTTEAREQPERDGVVVESVQTFTGAQPVQGVPVVRDTLWLTVVASGEAAANRRARVYPRTAGTVLSIRAREGQFVQAGALLVQLDTLEAMMNLEQARAALQVAQNDFRVGQLQSGSIADVSAREERERNLRFTTGLHSAEAQVARAEMELERTRVRAPFSGRIANIDVVQGQYASAGTELLTLVQLDPIKIEVNVLEAEVAYLAPGRRAQVQFTAIPAEVFQARVETINPVVDPETRASRVTLVLSNPGERVKPGMYARVSLESQSYPDRTLVPREAVTERDRRPVVFILKNPTPEGTGVAEWRYVTLGLRNERLVEIVPHEETSMLQPGEIVLVDGHHYMAHDIPVRLVENVRTAGGRPGR